MLRSVADHEESASIIVRYRTKPIQALVDTGSELTIACLNLAKEHCWKIRPTELQAVKVANGESMPIHGIATEILTVGKRSVRSEIFITPDITDLILGIDWQRKQGSTHWDHAKRRIKFGSGEWIPLRTGTEANEYRNVSRIYVETDVVLRPKQETDVPVRVGRSFMQGEPLAGVTESYKMPNLSRVYSGRTLLPARTSNLES